MMNKHALHHAGSTAPLSVMTRRGALNVSVGSAIGTLLGSNLSSAFAADSAPPTSEMSVILLWLLGGPFQQETFDPKDSNDEKLALRFKPIRSTAPEIQLASCMPNMSQVGHHLTIIRSMLGLEMEHSLAQYYMQTGYRSTGPIQAPAVGSIVAHELGDLAMQRTQPDGLPPYISIAGEGYSSGHFGPAYKPTIVWDPEQPPENLGLPSGVSPEVFNRRLNMVRSLESRTERPMAKYFSAGRESAARFMKSSQRAAFDLTKESDRKRKEYGPSKFGQGCLLARRLVEAGVRFVQVTSEDLDQHSGHYPKHVGLLHELDQGMSSLIKDLEERNLLQNTVVVATGEFGRTPVMNGSKPDSGRDHFLKGYSVCAAGGGFAPGRVYGATVPTGEDIDADPVSVPDFMATLLSAVGIDPEEEYYDDFERPIKLVDKGRVIRDVLA